MCYCKTEKEKKYIKNLLEEYFNKENQESKKIINEIVEHCKKNNNCECLKHILSNEIKNSNDYKTNYKNIDILIEDITSAITDFSIKDGNTKLFKSMFKESIDDKKCIVLNKIVRITTKIICKYLNKCSNFDEIFKILNIQEYATRILKEERNEIITKITQCIILERRFDFIEELLNLSLVKNPQARIITNNIIAFSKSEKEYDILLSLLELFLSMESEKGIYDHIKRVLVAILNSKEEYIIYRAYEIMFNEKGPRKESFCVSKYYTQDIIEENENLALRNIPFKLWSSSRYSSVSGIHEIILGLIKKPTFIDTALLFSFEAHDILIKYKSIDFKNFIETHEALKKLKRKYTSMNTVCYIYDNVEGFLKYINRLLNHNKTILSLWLLTNYGIWNSKAQAKELTRLYSKAFILLERYEIISKYVGKIGILDESIDIIEASLKESIKIKDMENARNLIKKLEYMEPSHPYIYEAKKKIDELNLIDELQSKNIDIDEINTLNGKDFENLIISNFNNLGFLATNTPATGDFGADIIVETDNGTRIIVQCKRFKNKVNLKAVQEVVGAISHYQGDIGIVITNNEFLNSAKKLADSNDVELWGRNELMKFLLGDVSFSEIKDL